MGRKTLPPCPAPSGSSSWKEAWYLQTGQMGKPAAAWLSERTDSYSLDNQGCEEGGTLRLERGCQGASGREAG